MIIVDKEFESLIPPLSDDEFKQLEDNILRDGIRDPLCLWRDGSGQDILIDGHNRFKIAAQHGGIPFQTKYILCADRETAKQWIIQNQFGRRNLTPFQRSELALKLKPVIQEEAKERQNLGLKSAQGERTNKRLGTIAGVGKDTIRKVEHVLAQGSEETKEAARSGKISVNEAFKRTVKENEPPKPDIPSAKEEHEAFMNAPVVSMDEIQADKHNQRTIALNLYTELSKTYALFEKLTLTTTVEEISNDSAGLTDDEREDLINQMHGVINCAKSIIHALGGD